MALYLGQLLLKLCIVILFTSLTFAEAHDGTFLAILCNLGADDFFSKLSFTLLGLHVLDQKNAQAVVGVDPDTFPDDFCVSGRMTHFSIFKWLHDLGVVVKEKLKVAVAALDSLARRARLD